jgi:hypothetical protein
VGEERYVYAGVRWEDLLERDHLVDLEVDRRIMLKWNFKK